MDHSSYGWQLALLAGALLLSLCRAVDSPIIGVWTEPANRAGPPCNGQCDVIAASYIKWVESAGGRAVAVPYNATHEQVDSILAFTNGILFPGGAVDLPQGARYAIQRVMDINDAGIHFPIWGTCLGFEWIVQAIAGVDTAILDGYDALNISLPVNFTENAENSRLFSILPEHLKIAISSKAITFNSHTKGITPQSFASFPQLLQTFNVLAINSDRHGKPFVSAIEAKKYPIYGVQWHPEKANFEYGELDGRPLVTISHSPHAVAASWYLAYGFINEARINSNVFPDQPKQDAALLYNVPTSDQFAPYFVEAYVFTPSYNTKLGHVLTNAASQWLGMHDLRQEQAAQMA